MQENFIRTFEGPLNKNQTKILVKEFNSIENKANLKLNLDGSDMGQTAYIESATEAEKVLVEFTSRIIGEYILDLGVPYHFKSMMDEGYQIQRWDATSPHWLSTVDETAPNKVLQVLMVLQAKKGASIKFRHHGEIPLTAGTTLVFPALYTHSYMLNPVAAKGIYLISTGVRTILETEEE